MVNYEDEKKELLEWWGAFLEGVKCNANELSFF